MPFPPFSVVNFRITRLNRSCVFSPSLHLGHVVLLDLIVFTWLDLLFHLTCSHPFNHPGHVFTRLGNVLLSLSACPSFNLLMLLSLLFILFIASFYLLLTLSCPSVHFTFSSPFYPRITNKQSKRRDQHASQHIRLERSFRERAAGLACATAIGSQRWDL